MRRADLVQDAFGECGRLPKSRGDGLILARRTTPDLCWSTMRPVPETIARVFRTSSTKTPGQNSMIW